MRDGQKASTNITHRLRWLKSASLSMGLSVAILALAIMTCSLPSERKSESLIATQLALEVEATTLALERMRLTQQAEAQQESPPPLATETPLPPMEESTATPTPETQEPESPEDETVEGSLVRAPFDPAYGWGPSHDAENFDGEKGIFPETSAGAAVSWYEGGRYHITFTSRNRWTWYWSFIEAIDFYVDVVVINGDQCVAADTAGMVFRGNSTDDDGLMFGISCGGQYFIGITDFPGVDGAICTFWDSGIDCNRRDLSSSDLIQSGPGAINRIGVQAKGQDLDFYINGRLVDSRSLAMSWPLFNHGTFALYLGSAQKPNARASFDDFSVWYLE